MRVENLPILPNLWDEAVAAMPEANPFMYSWALNILCNQWKVSVWQKNTFLPIPLRKKYGMWYAYQVPFVPFFSMVPIGQMGVSRAINSFVPYLDVCTSFPLRKNSKKCTNYVVQLFDIPSITYQRFSKEGKRNIEKAQNRGCQVIECWNPELHCKIYDEAYGGLQATHTQRQYTATIIFAKEAFDRGKLLPLQVVQKQTGEVLSSAWILKEKNQLFYWMAAPTALGRQCRSTYFLIHYLTQTFAGQYTHLQLLGSDVDAVAHFYRHFGGVNIPYYHTRYHWLQPFGVK